MQASAATQPFEVWHLPPGLLLRGEPVTLHVSVDGPIVYTYPPRGYAYVRGDPGAAFTRIPMAWNSDLGGMTASVPSAALAGSILDDYVVVTDPATNQTLTVPPAGATGPYRSWILDAPPTVSLGVHRFGRLRAADAVVAKAMPGTGAGQVGFSCPPEGVCESPWSIDVGPDGTVWVTDPANHRLLAWDPGSPGLASRALPLDFGSIDVAIGPGGTIYVSGVKPPDGDPHIRLYAFAPDGHQLWMSRLLTEIFNSQIRMGPNGVLYSVDPRYGWAPAMAQDGQPLSLASQRKRTLSNEPVPGGQRLVVAAPWDIPPGHLAPIDWRVALTTAAGELQRAWRITSATDLGPPQIVTPAVVGGDPVVFFAVYDFDRHLKECLVLHLAPDGGLAGHLSLDGRAAYSEPITALRVGPDGALYQMQSDPIKGLKIARYAL